MEQSYVRRFQRYQVLLYFRSLVIAVSFSIGSLLAGEPAESEPSRHVGKLQTLKTTEGVEFGIWGRIGNTLQPTLIVLASTVEDTLSDPYFRQCGNQLAGESGWLCVSIDLPCHGSRRRDGEPGGLTGWSSRVENGEDFVKAFNRRLSRVLDYLILHGYSDPKRLAACGTSRGGFLAVHFAAADKRVGCVAAFAPVTDLAKLREFKGIEDNALTQKLSLANHAVRLDKRSVWIVIGDQDQRVSTDAAIGLARQLTAAKCVVVLHVMPEPRGHTTPKGAPAMAARWIRSRFEPAEPRWQYNAKFLRPVWQGDTVEGESVLFIRDPKTGEAKASVLFPVLKILSVRNSAGDVTYEEGRDYRWTPESRELTLPANSRIISRTPAELRRPAGSQKYKLTHRDGNGEILFGSKLDYHGMQTCITYTHAPEEWKSRIPTFDAKVLPRTIEKLRDRKPVSIVLIGDSISAGCNASGWAGEAPFQPSFPGLLQQHLAAHYQTKVRMTNPSVSGKDTRWVLSAIDKVVEPRPDLVIIAFGMNDAAGRSAKEYQANTKSVIAKIRERLPDAEFILVASMLENRNWTTLKHDLFPQYRDALAELCEPGIALADMTSLWTEFLKRKKDWDLTGNGVNHPNDFGHRVYAQVLSTLLVPPVDFKN